MQAPAKPLTESETVALEDQFPSLAKQAFREARQKTIAAGIAINEPTHERSKVNFVVGKKYCIE